MYFEFPENEEAYKQEGQYFWGDAFLYALITVVGTGADKMAKKKCGFLMAFGIISSITQHIKGIKQLR